MRFYIIFISALMLFVGESKSNEVSLIEQDVLSKVNSEVETNLISNEEDDSQELERSYEDQDFLQMNDFIHKEDDKIKDIKLLNLDLEKSTLELKKREIEQKIAQLQRREVSFVLPSKDDRDDAKEVKPFIKLRSIFESQFKKQAVLNIDGTDINVTEGQKIKGVVIRGINQKVVVVEYGDGATEELSLS